MEEIIVEKIYKMNKGWEMDDYFMKFVENSRSSLMQKNGSNYEEEEKCIKSWIKKTGFEER